MDELDLEAVDFDAVVAVVRCWRNGSVDLEVRGAGGPLDGRERIVHLERGEGNALLIELARAMAVRS